ncbi:MAG: (d)CMP kinase [Planctomycetota bacterium]|nr:(d)CMP kinase [Planctomycetota bacterium]
MEISSTFICNLSQAVRIGYTTAMIITIDGPAGAGKSTVARRLAGRLGIAYLDTGTTYRAVTLKALRDKVNLADASALAETARRANIELTCLPDGTRVLLDGRDVTQEIRSAEVSEKSHHIAQSPGAREVLVELQRRLGKSIGAFVAEGRDQGSVVFPEADVKFYLDAKPSVRARRRCDEMADRGEQADYQGVLAAILRRDSRDRRRDVAPLVKPKGAVEIDTSDMTIEQVVDHLVNCLERKR